MTIWQRWMRRPQRVWLRRALFQVHLWSGLALGLYIVVLSVTGSALVYRRELVAYFRTPFPRYDASAQRLSTDDLRATAERAYPGYEVGEVTDTFTRRNPVINIGVTRNGEKKERLFNPYTGADLGDAFTQGERAVLWVVRLHDELLFGGQGRYWNGVASAFVTVLCVTGAIVWWPGVSRWRRSLIVKTQSGWRRFNWDLHSAMGAWLFLFMFMWGVSGFYLGVPEPFSTLVDYIYGPLELEERAGDVALAWLSRLHFGRWQSGSLKALWAVVGLVPVMMFVTGVLMWWNRVLRKRPSLDIDDAPLSEAL